MEIIEKIKALPSGGILMTSEGNPPNVISTDELKALVTLIEQLTFRIENNLGGHDHCHDVVCNADTRKPRGCDMCSCNGRVERQATLIEQQSAVIEEAEKALEHYAENDNWCEADWNNPHHLEIVYIGNRTEADRRHGYDIATSALARIQQIRGEAK